MARKKGGKKPGKVRRSDSKGPRKNWESYVGEGAEDGEQFDNAVEGRMVSRKSQRKELLRRIQDDPVAVRLENTPESKLLEGIVVKSAGTGYFVDTPAGVLTCKLRGAFKQFELEQENIVAVGDRVKVLDAGENEGVVTEVLPRRTKLSRANPQLKSAEKVIVANVDQVVIVSSVAFPALRPRLIDRYLIACEKSELEPLICVNKIDLAADNSYGEITQVYEQLGYRVIYTSATNGIGIDELRDQIAGKSNVFSGHSGVGKSTLLERIQPGLKLAAAPVTDYGKGRHRTSHVELIRLEVGGYVVDTPGIREFALWQVEAGEIEAYFREIKPLVEHCKFPDCTHLNEPGCAVLKALEERRISPLRYESYQLLLEELATKKPN